MIVFSRLYGREASRRRCGTSILRSGSAAAAEDGSSSGAGAPKRREKRPFGRPSAAIGGHRASSRGSRDGPPSRGGALPVSCPRDSCTMRSFFPFPRQKGTRRRCGAIVKGSRRPEGPPGGVPPTPYAGGAPATPGEAGKATRRAVLRGPRTSSRAACDAPASRRAVLLAGNLARPSYSVRISGTGH